jgi:hypothetical protein
LARLAGFEGNAGIGICGAIMGEIAQQLSGFVGGRFLNIFMKAVDVL